jgi:site-specific recombinase XerD
MLDASNDYEAVQAWLSLHESAATQRTYRKEAERLILWAIVERGRALSSLTTEDAVAYRTFLRRPTPRERWVGPLRPRSSPDWRPFAGNLSARSAAHALSILGALFRWLIEQRYVLANPFAGVKVRGSGRAAALDASRAFTEGEWRLVRTIADGLEWSYGWTAPAAHRLRFLLDMGFASGLRASEMVGATLGHIETDARGEHWLRVTGKGHKVGKVALPPLAWEALTHYLLVRRLPVSPARRNRAHRWSAALRPTWTGRSAPCGCGRFCDASFIWQRSRLKPTVRRSPASCAGRVRTGCGTRMRRMRSPTVQNLRPYATTCGMPRSRLPPSTCMAMTSGARGRSPGLSVPAKTRTHRLTESPARESFAPLPEALTVCAPGKTLAARHHYDGTIFPRKM